VRYEEYVASAGLLNHEEIESIKNEFKEKIEEELKIGFAAKPIEPDTDEEIEDVYAKAQDARHKVQVIDNSSSSVSFDRRSPDEGASPLTSLSADESSPQARHDL